MHIHRDFSLGLFVALLLMAFILGTAPNSPAAYAQSEPNATVTATLTATLTATATPSATETITASITIATITPTPSATPIAFPTSEVTDTPVASATSTALATPEATSTPAQAATNYKLYLPWLTETRIGTPEITAPTFINTNEDTPVSATLRIVDVDTAPTALLISATVQSTAVISTIALQSDNGITFTLWLTPTSNAFGQSEVRIYAKDDHATTQATIAIQVQPVNDAPTLVGLGDIEMRPNITRSIGFTVTDVESDSQQLHVGLGIANAALLPPTNAILEGSGLTRTLVITTNAGITGTSAISVSVSDGGLTTTIPFTLTVADDACPDLSANSYITIAIQPFSSGGLYYKDNRLTDENADFRLSILGYTPTTAITDLVDYGGDIDPLAPRIYGVVKPKRLISVTHTYERYDWLWNENAAPPYGTRGGVNHEWAASVIDLDTQRDEPIYIPERPGGLFETGIWQGDYKAMVLYAAEHEILITYTRNDRVDHGYALYLANLCVDPNLVRVYREQLLDGKRNTSWLPALRNSDVVGTARGSALTIAVRDSGPFLDPRSRKDWWQGY